MRTSFTFLVILLSLAAVTRPALSDCILGAPGVPAGTQVCTKVPFEKEVSLPGCYKFVFTGIEAKGNTTGGGSGSGGSGWGWNGNNPSENSSSYNNGYNSGYSNGCNRGYDDGYNDGWRNRSHNRNRNYDDDDRYHWWFWPSNSYNRGYYSGYDYGYTCGYDRGYDYGCNRNSTGSLTCKATVKDTKPTPKSNSCQLQFRDVSDFNSCPLKTHTMSPTCVYRADKTPMVIKLNWKCEGSAPKPNGNFNILAEYQKDPPPPTGTLTFAVGDWMLQTTSEPRPDGIAKIVRE